MRGIPRALVTAALAAAVGCSDHELPTAPDPLPTATPPAADCAGGPPVGLPARVEGLVFTPGNAAVAAGARVQIGGVGVIADDEGRFVLETGSGPAVITVTAAGTLGAGGELRVLPGSQNLFVPLVLEGTTDGYVFGRVADACSGEPVAGATVGWFGASADDGSFWASACCSTVGAIDVSAAGYETITLHLGRYYDQSAALDVLLQPIRPAARGLTAPVESAAAAVDSSRRRLLE